MKIKIHWPVPGSHDQKIQSSGAGFFWEDRGDRFHCGVDIYAPFGSNVKAMDDGLVVQTQLFTSRQMIDYWNDTFAVIIQHESGFVARYAEMHDVSVCVGERIKTGELLGHVGKVLQPSRITKESPVYIQKLKENENSTMLHLEMFDRFPFEIPKYLGGNTFQNERPDCLLDPTDFFQISQ